MYTIIIILSLIIIVLLWYNSRLRKAINYAVEVLKKYESAILMDDIIRKVHEDESKTN